LPDLAAIRRVRPERRAISIASITPFSGVTRPMKTRSSDRFVANGASASESPLWMTADHATSGCIAACARLIATRWPRAGARRPAAQGRSRRPWYVVTTGTGEAIARSPLYHSMWL
jgi:hypothetical protein